MRELRKTLLRMKDINARMAKAVHRSDRERNAAIVSLRQDFTEECGHFLTHLQQIIRIPAKRHLFEILQERFQAMRSRLASHQMAWSTTTIASNYNGYINASKMMHGNVESFVDECLDTIADDITVEIR